MKLKYFLLAAFSGVLLVLSFPFLNVGKRCLAFPFLVWLALFPLLFSIKRVSAKQAFFVGLLAGFVFFLGLTYWLVFLMPRAGYLIIVGWILLSLLEGALVAIFAWLASLAYKRFEGVFILFLIPSFWVALELLRSIGGWNFSWGLLGLAASHNLVVFQLLSLFGVFGVSFVIVLTGVFLVEAADFFLKKRKGKGNILKKAIVTLVVVLLTVGWGVFSLAKKQQPMAQVKVSLVQANISQDEKWSLKKSDDIRKIYFALTKKAAKGKPYLIIWPESALPSYFSDERDFVRQAEKVVLKHKLYLLLGSLHNKNYHQFNSAFLIGPNSKPPQRYDKLKLVLFGEYIPNWPVFNQIKEMLDLGKSLSAGKRLVVFSTAKGRLATVICFESADAFLCRQLVLKGAQARLSSPEGSANPPANACAVGIGGHGGGQALVVLTNDAWFGKSPLAYQHLAQARARAVENNVYMTQAANTGLSAVISPQGKIVAEVPLFERKVLTSRVAFRRGQTFYTRFGYLFAYFCLLATLAATVYLGYEARSKNKAGSPQT